METELQFSWCLTGTIISIHCSTVPFIHMAKIDGRFMEDGLEEMQSSIFPYSLKSVSQLRETFRELLNWTAHWPTHLLPSDQCFSYRYQIFSTWDQINIFSLTSYQHVSQITGLFYMHSYYWLYFCFLHINTSSVLNLCSTLIQDIICKGCIYSLITSWHHFAFIFQRISLKSLNILSYWIVCIYKQLKSILDQNDL